MQTASSRIWTRVTNSISYHDKHDTKLLSFSLSLSLSLSIYIYIYLRECSCLHVYEYLNFPGKMTCECFVTKMTAYVTPVVVAAVRCSTLDFTAKTFFVQRLLLSLGKTCCNLLTWCKSRQCCNRLRSEIFIFEKHCTCLIFQSNAKYSYFFTSVCVRLPLAFILYHTQVIWLK